MRESILGYANGWYRAERSPEAFLDAAKAVIAKGFKAFKLDPFGTAQGVISEAELELAYAIVRELRDKLPRDTLILIDVHARFTEAEALRARRDMVYAQHQIAWALDRLCELDGARWVYDNDELGAIRRDVMTILTHHAASRQAAMAPYGRLLLARDMA